MKRSAVVLAGLLALAVAFSAGAKIKHDSAVFVVDVSGTVKDAGEVEDAQRIVVGMNERFPSYVKSGGLLAFGRLRQQQLEWLVPVAGYNKSEMISKTGTLVGTEGPTPLGAAVRESGIGVEAAEGKTALIIVSDGRDTGYSDPVANVRELKKKHGSDLCVFTIQLGSDVKGGELLAALVKEGECGTASTAASLKDPKEIQALVDYIFPQEAPPPPPPKPAPLPVIPQDSDGDGVFDQEDQCPGTPRGARVDYRGCWVLTDIKFDVDKSEIKPQYFMYLDEVVGVLLQNPELRIIIEGHTDADGTDEYNLKLSNNRAKAVMDYFVMKGADPTRLSAVGLGESKPIADNETDEGKAQNRRIELTVSR